MSSQANSPSRPLPRLPRVPRVPRLGVPGLDPRRALRERVGAALRGIVAGGGADGPPAWLVELADDHGPGYFTPGDAVWTVHADLATLVGGIRALLLQCLHPAAVAGVDRHSSYREDPLGRLAGTTRWLTVTTFGSTAAAEREAARVRGLHRRVTGSHPTPNGPQPYRAADPHLLGWVHVAFTDSFLTAHQRFGATPIPGGPDAYVAGWAHSARLLGLTHPPADAAELAATLDRYGPELAATEVTARTLDFLRRPPLPPPAQAGYAVLFAAAASTLRPEHRALLGLPAAGRRVPQVAAGTLLAGLRAMLPSEPPAAQQARRRPA